MDVKTAFLNGDLDEEVYMKQPEGFVMPGNEHKVCKLVKSLYGLKQAPKQWHQKFDEVVLSSGFHLNQSDKFDKTKKFLSSRFSMKDMGEADIILGIKIKRENKGIVITQSHYIEKILKKFNREDCSPVNTPMDPVEKLKPNTGNLLSTKDYGLSYVGYPLVLEGYSDASWINHVEDSSSMSGWVFLLGGGRLFMASIRSKHGSLVLYGIGLEIGTQVLSSQGARSKGTTYVNMKFSSLSRSLDLLSICSSKD
ncbi:zinc finger, CCHC-type containing protein [Tanacetum coccineum]